MNRNALTPECDDIFKSNDKYKVELATDNGACPIGADGKLADRSEIISYKESCIEYEDGQFQARVYIRKVTSTGDIDVSSGIPIACQPQDFSISTEINIEDQQTIL